MGNHSLATADAAPFVVAIGEGAAVRQLAVSDPEHAFRALMRLLAEAPQDVCGAWGVSWDWPEPISLVARYQRGLVGETMRVAHIVPMRPGEWHGHSITAWCRRVLAMADLEFLDPGQGMSCVECMRRAPLPQASDQGRLPGQREALPGPREPGPGRRERGQHMAAPLQRDSTAVTAAVITPADPPWPSTDPDRTAEHLRRVLDALDTSGSTQDGPRRS